MHCASLGLFNLGEIRAQNSMEGSFIENLVPTSRIHIQGATTPTTTIFSGVADSSVLEESACQIEVVDPDNDTCREVSQLTNSTRPNVVKGRILPIPTSTKTTFESAPILVRDLIKEFSDIFRETPSWITAVSCD